MRKRNIKSIAHWVIMSIVLLFPILMVGVSSFAQKQQEIHVSETYEYETNEVNSVDDLVVGNIYKFKMENILYNTNLSNVLISENNMDSGTNFLQYINYGFSVLNNKFNSMALRNLQYNYNTDFSIDFYNFTVLTHKAGSINNYSILFSSDNDIDNICFEFETEYKTAEEFDYNFTFYFICLDNTKFTNVSYVSASDYLGEKTIDYTITDQTMRDDVNEWCSSFRNLPVNQWYGNMLDTIGLGITNSMMMNVIYTYPLYVLWVYIIDLVVDCLLVIINFGHNALKRLGGDNE